MINDGRSCISGRFLLEEGRLLFKYPKMNVNEY